MSVNSQIIDSILNSKPLASGKMGSIEADSLRHYFTQGPRRNWDIPAHNKTLRLALEQNTGVFPAQDLILDKWCKVYLESVTKLDDVIMWCPEYGDEFIIKNFCTTTRVHNIRSKDVHVMDQMNFGVPEAYSAPKIENWFKNLENKRVLVVSPFVNSIRSQLSRLSSIWNHDFSSTTFQVIRFPYAPSVSGVMEDKSCFHLLKRFKNILSQSDFDLLIIGAGSYSLPLVAHAKSLGKIGVHLGGACQLFFGIRGTRWDNLNEFKESKLYNSELFIRPLQQDLPANSKIVENGCYW